MTEEEKHKKEINEYYKNPKVCKYCGRIIPFCDKDKVREFCNSVCAFSYLYLNFGYQKY